MFEPGTRVLVTGATSGLGAETARQLGARGCRLALTGRRAERLQAAAAAARDAGAADVLALEGSVTELDTVREHHRAIEEAWGGLDVLFLNAGVGDSCGARDFTAQNYRLHLDVNVLGVCSWLELCLPGLLAAGRGTIVGISSPAGWRGYPGVGPYAASKAALSTMLESLRVELRRSGVDVITVYPGFVRSEMTDRNDPKDMPFLLGTDDGVRRMLRGVERRRAVVRFPWLFTTFVRYVVRPMPRFVFDPLMHRLSRRFAWKRDP